MKHDQMTQSVLRLLDLHYESFYAAEPAARATGHPVPTDTRGWSQIIVSTLCGIKGLERQKGADLADGSDVKGANTWKAIDTPRFNGVIKAGTKATVANKIASPDAMPHLYLVLWDETIRSTARCRIWVVRPQHDAVFRAICAKWYAQRGSGEIHSANFQLHPPRGKDTDIITNNCGTLQYPLYFSAERAEDAKYTLLQFKPQVRISGKCIEVPQKHD
ncbi:MAG: MamI family restriction endonuclease [Phycisphaeraceae bacterium]